MVVILIDGALATPEAKTAHGLIREGTRYRIVSVVASAEAGRDAGEVLDGRARGIPVHASLEAMFAAGVRPDYALVGVATHGGRLPESIRAMARVAIEHGVHVVSGLHELLADDADLVAAAARSGSRLIDIRKPKRATDLPVWTGEALSLDVPRIAVLGMDCAIGKRTTCRLLLAACRAAGLRAEMIYTGQTGWMQGGEYGFIYDATLVDFVSGELEQALVRCAREASPDVMLIEGQSSLLNPLVPCGSVYFLAGGVRGVVLQHAPGRRYYDGLESIGREIAPVASEMRLIEQYGARTLALTLNGEGMSPEALAGEEARLSREHGIPVVRPLEAGVGALVDVVRRFVDEEHRSSERRSC
jgi:uncharacterized NAD-dependent epimerase/dehydratase family protein